MKQPILLLLALAAGLLLMVLGLVPVGWVIPTQAVWTDADARAYTKAGVDLHAALHHQGEHGQAEAGHPPAAASAGPLSEEAARAAFAQVLARRDAAVARQQWCQYAIRIVGVALAALAIGGYVFKRMD